ncbi:polysaccharide pyruvyl transferase family protein [Sphingobacterium rhinopitheci]|uniref:polysaccharide pyruvyl transferase family protein n=1 Tax=Sphingobacterium rhinopitheci TaxID=2781960 RepID=UPI001F5257FB|nr:polysaccharide pyruvyl transferase family protein [Sphingobacterium rhinopitheci]MCI0922714.1 polysaccharide pyruvyl transferase family protein [Sphingobacterium rhinopitheci]
MNIVLANMPINNGNRGCVALSISTMYIVDKIMRDNNIAYKFYLPDSGFKDNKERTINIGGREIKYTSCAYPIGLNKIDIKHWAKSILKFKEYFSNRSIMKNADFILDIGQGDSFSDIYGLRRFNIIDRVHRLARFYKKPYCILPQTIGPFSDNNIKYRALLSLQKADMVMARDFQSLSYVKENLPQKSIDEYIDVAFLMPFKKRKLNDEYTHVGLNISGLLWNGGYTGNNQFGLKSDFQSTVKNIINYFLSFSNVKVHLVSHVLLGEVNVENDYAVSYDLYNKLNDDRIVLAPFFFCPMEAKSYISGMDFFVGARMHATIAAFSSGVPVLPLAYSRKFNGLFVDTLQYNYLGDLINQNQEELMDSLKNAFESREQLKNIIEHRLNGVVKQRGELLHEKLRGFFLLQNK